MSDESQDFRIKMNKARIDLLEAAMTKTAIKTKSGLIFHLLEVFVSKPNLFEDSIVNSDLQSMLQTKILDDTKNNEYLEKKFEMIENQLANLTKLVKTNLNIKEETLFSQEDKLDDF